jgi:hypothetical protein
MTETTGFGYLGIQLCDSCYKPNHVFVLSDGQKEYCVRCIRESHYSENLLGIPNGETHPILDLEVTSCEVCELPELDQLSTRWNLVDAYLSDATTIIQAHKCCTAIMCRNCDKVYAHNGNRSWRGEYKYSRSDFTSTTKIEGDDLCDACNNAYWEENDNSDYFECNSCESWTHYDSSGWYEGSRFCHPCIETNVYDCGECGESRWDGDDHDCEESVDEENNLIHDYSYKPSPFFFGEGKYHFGFELEVESRGNGRYEGAAAVQSFLGGRAYFKNDASLDEGFEIVTHPHTLENYHKEFDWNFLRRLQSDGYRSWNTGSCGLHVHVSRTAFGAGDPWDRGVPMHTRSRLLLRRQSHELRFMKLIYDNQRQVERIAGRTSAHYANFSDKGNLVRKVKDGYQNNGRMSAVNTENSETIEIRVFKGSLRKERVLSAIEFVHASVEYTRDIKVTSKNLALSWINFTGYVGINAELYPNLVTIMSESFASESINDGDN